MAWENHANSINCIQKLKKDGYNIISIEQAEQAVMLNDFTPQKDVKYALIFGNEVKGVEQAIVSASDTVIEIPQYGTKHSLNISVSLGIVIWDFFQKLQV